MEVQRDPPLLLGCTVLVQVKGANDDFFTYAQIKSPTKILIAECAKPQDGGLSHRSGACGAASSSANS